MEQAERADESQPPKVGYRPLLALESPRRLVAAAIPADFADWLDYAAVLALLVFVWGEGPLVLAFFALALSVPYVVIGPFLAMLVDRTPIRSVLVLSNAGRAIATVGLIFAGDTALVLGLVFLRSTIDSAFTPARQAAIKATTPKELLQVANGLHHAINQTSKIVGPAIGGLLLAALPIDAVFAINAAISLIAAGISATVLIAARPSSEPEAPAGFLKRSMVGFAEFGRNRLLRLALIFSVTAYFAIFLYDALIPLLTQNLGFDETIFGFAISASGLGGLIGALAAGRTTSLSPFQMMAGAATIGGAVTIVLGAAALSGWSVGVVIFLVAAGAMGGAFGYQTVPYRTLIQSETAEDRIARVYAAGESVTVGVMLAAPFIGSLIAEALGTGAAFVAGGSVLLLLGLGVALRRATART